MQKHSISQNLPFILACKMIGLVLMFILHCFDVSLFNCNILLYKQKKHISKYIKDMYIQYTHIVNTHPVYMLIIYIQYV